MRNNKKRTIIIVLVIAIILGICCIVNPINKALSFNKYEGDSQGSVSGNYVITGNLSIFDYAEDEEFGVTSKSPIMIRNVEMVQWYKDENGIRKVLANYELPSFKEDGIEYNNPKFNNEITSDIFYGNVYIGGVKIKLGERVLEEFVTNDEFAKTKVDVEVPQINRRELNLIYKGNAYITASNDWEVGDIKVSYYALDIDISKKYSIAGTIKDNVIEFNGYGLIKEGSISLTKIKTDVFKHYAVHQLG